MDIVKRLKGKSRIDYINYLILAYAFVLSFPVAIKTPILVVLIVFWLSDSNKYTPTPKEIKKIFIFMGLFFLFISLSIFWSDADLTAILKYIKKIWYFLPIFIIYKYIKKEYISYAISSFLLGISLVYLMAKNLVLPMHHL